MSALEVLIVSAENFRGLARVPRLLRRAGCRVSVLAPAGSRLASSSFVDEDLGGTSDPDAALDRLRGLLDRGRRWDWVVLGDDVVLDRAARRKSEGWLAPLLPARGGDAAVDALVSKTAFSRAMSACGVPMSPGIGASGAEAVLRAAAEIGFPAIVKPDRGFAGGGVFVAADAGALRARAGAVRGEFLVERFTEGRVAGAPALYDRGRLVWWTSFEKVGVFPPPLGPSCRRRPLRHLELAGVLGRIGTALGLHGLFGVDWIATTAGGLSVVELNGRPIPMMLGTPAVEEDLPRAIGRILRGEAPPPCPPRDEPPEDVFHALPESLQLAWAESDWKTLAGLLSGAAGRTDIPWDDPGLLRSHVATLARGILRLAGRPFRGVGRSASPSA